MSNQTASNEASDFENRKPSHVGLSGGFPMSSSHKTRCGYEVRIYANDGGITGDVFHGAVFLPVLNWFPFSWTNGGRAYSDYQEHDFDLMQ